MTEPPDGLRASTDSSGPASHLVEREKTMNDLPRKKCEPCRTGAPLVTEEEVRELMPGIPEWEIIEIIGIRRLRRTFSFPDFLEALAFTNQVGALAEEEGHHPTILTEWGQVTVTWWSHKLGGLHMNDFIMAAKTDQLI